MLLVVGFLAAWVGYDAWIASQVVLHPNATRAAAHALLQTPAVQRGLADQLTTTLEHQLPAAAKDPHTAPAVAAAVRDPRVSAAFADTVARIHQAVITNDSPHGPRTFTIDGRALTSALHDALARRDPQLAAEVERVPPLAVHIKSKDLPHLNDPRSTADVVVILAISAALLLITASLLVRHDRRSIARAGRRTAFLAITPLLVFVVLPRVLTHASGDAPQIASALLRVYGNRVLPSAIALALVGLAIVVGAIVWPRHLAEPASTTAPLQSYTGPTPSPSPSWATPDQPTITKKMYL